ncbi:MAG: YfiR family protein [Mariprofundaceae bacterium]
MDRQDSSLKKLSKIFSLLIEGRPFCTFAKTNKTRAIALLACLFLAPQALIADEPTPTARENEIKAVYIYNFIRFTEWPDEVLSTDQPVKLSVFGNLPLLKALKKDSFREMIKSANIETHPCQMPGCLKENQALFIDSSQSRQLTNIIKSLNHRPVLTISDIPGFADRGGMIEMKNEHGRVVFIVNLRAAFKAKLYISAQLLQLAELVETQP